MKHKHCELIKAWAEGAEIEYLFISEWKPIEKPSWDEKTEYRVKPNIETWYYPIVSNDHSFEYMSSTGINKLHNVDEEFKGKAVEVLYENGIIINVKLIKV